MWRSLVAHLLWEQRGPQFESEVADQFNKPGFKSIYTVFSFRCGGFMLYTVYITTNLVNGKYYIGVHKTLNPEDTYLGSGTLLRRAVLKYGREFFKKEVISVYDDPKSAYAEEAALIILGDPLCYNIKQGGHGGFDFINTSEIELHNTLPATLAWAEKLNDPSYYSEWKKRVVLARLSSVKWQEAMRSMNSSRFKGKSHSEDTKKRMSEAKKGLYLGSNNPWYDTCWVHNTTENIRIPKEDLPKYLEEGWVKGRVMSLV